ncbi:MAG: iron ABC transporter permease [Rhodothermaceae bacterium]|nr:iron ABC transporter permease [Rhodothermaceae bacterium]
MPTLFPSAHPAVSLSALRRVQLRPYLWGPVVLVTAGVLVPLGYLVLRAFEADAATLAALVFRARNAMLLGHTVGLAVGVLAVATVLAVPLAWLVTRTDLRGKRLATLLGVLPLAIPGYVMAYALLGATSRGGLLVGLGLPRPSGYTGALLALGLYTFPYLFLNLRSALLGLDPSLEEAARSLGTSPRQVARRVVLPQLRPAFFAGSLLVVLHVLGDFGVVSLMRFETFSYAIYLQYSTAFDRIYAAWLALMLLSLTGGLLVLEARLLRGRQFARTGSGAARRADPTPLGRWTIPAYAFIVLVGLASVGVPVATVLHWLGRGAESVAWGALGSALWDSTRAAVPAALVAAALALPVAYLGVRRPSPAARVFERIAYLGYATPPLAFALALIVFSLRAMPGLYQSLALLIGAYALHFLAEAIGPVRSALYQAPPRVQEAARILGRSPLRAFFDATFPLLRRGLGVSAAFVFLSALKELPITFLLSPLGFRSLAMGVWSAAGESLFAVAAPYALVLILTSMLLVGLLLRDT